MNSPGKLLWSMSGFCFLLFRFLSVLCEAVVISQGSVFLFLVPLSPSRPDPCWCLFACPLLFLVWFVSSTPCFFSLSLSLSLSLFLSQALGNPKPFWFGVPLVFLHPGHALRPRSVRLPLHLHPGQPRTCFFFFVVVARFRFGVFSFLVLSVSVVLVGVPGPGLCRVVFVSVFSLGLVALSFVWVGGVPLAAFSLCFPLGSLASCCSLASCICLALGRVTWSTDPQPPRPPALCLGSSRLARLLLGVVGGTRRVQERLG